MNLEFESWVRHRRVTDAEALYHAAKVDFAAVRSLERLIREFEPRLVITNTIVAPWAAIAAKLVGVPHVWLAHEFGTGHEFQLPREAVFTDIGLLSDAVVASSRALAEHLAQWVPREQLEVLYPNLQPVSAERQLSQASWPFPPRSDALKAVCVGRISESKGQRRLVRAVAKLAAEGIHVQAALVGSWVERERAAIEAMVRAEDLGGRIAFVGEVDDPSGYFEAADVAVVASDSEGFGRVTVEAMAMGVPVIGANTGANVELITHGETGRLFDLSDDASLASALRHYSTDRVALVENGRAARSTLLENLASRHQLSDLLPRLHAVAESGSAPVSKIPSIMMSWLSLPDTALEIIEKSGAMIDPRTSRTWRIGSLALAIPRRLLRTLRGRAR